MVSDDAGGCRQYGIRGYNRDVIRHGFNGAAGGMISTTGGEVAYRQNDVDELGVPGLFHWWRWRC
jgi:hypothetical protein